MALFGGSAGAGHTLRFYITPHFAKCQPVATLKLRLVAVTASRPSGFQKRRYAKCPAQRGRPGRRPWATVAGTRPPRPWPAPFPLFLFGGFFSVSALRACWAVSGLRPALGALRARSPPPTLSPRPLRGLSAPGRPVRPPGGSLLPGASRRTSQALRPCHRRGARPAGARRGQPPLFRITTPQRNNTATVKKS